MTEDFFEIPDQLTAAQANLLAASDTFDFFAESVRKQHRLREIASLSRADGFSKIYVVDNFVNLGNLAETIGGRGVCKRTVEWFQNLTQEACAEEFRNAIVLFTNNNLAAVGFDFFASLTQRYPQNLYLVWDFDNHHWLQCSGRGALLADIYVPAHYDHLFLISRFNAFTLEPTNCGVVQWRSDFLRNEIPNLLGRKRSDEPLGHHTPWNFPYRLKVLQTFSTHLPHVGVCSPEFNFLSAAERLEQWTSHKAHVVIPVYNDLPIRTFDALITGGIPILPRSLQAWARFSGITEEEAVFYDALDIVAPAGLVQAANALFDATGMVGMLSRIEKAHRMYHVDARVSSMVERSEKLVRSVR